MSSALIIEIGRETLNVHSQAKNWTLKSKAPTIYVDEKCINNWMLEKNVLLACMNPPNFKGTILWLITFKKIKQSCKNIK